MRCRTARRGARARRDERGGDPRAGRAERVPERDAAAVRVDVPRLPALVEPGVVEELQDDRCEGLVDLDHGHVVPGQAAFAAPARMRAGCRGASGTGRRRRARTRRTVHAARVRADDAASLVTSIAAAPSTIALELPAVILPPALNAGWSEASFSSEVSRRGFSSTATSTAAPAAPTSTGTISRSKRPSSMAAIARRCDSSEYSSSSLPREPPFVGDHLGRDALRHDLPALVELRGEPSNPFAVRFEPMGTRDIDSTPEATTTSR